MTGRPDGPLAALAASCIGGFDEGAMRVDQARTVIARLAEPVSGTETLPIREALGRVLAEDLVSPIDVPPHDNAAMDGFALRAGDIVAGHAFSLEVTGRLAAGGRLSKTPAAGECIRIMTGAALPDGLDTVVPQEAVRVEGSMLHVPVDAVKPGDHRRRAGEDLARGKVALRAGRRLMPADLGLLASLGIAEATVVRRLRVAFFATGDELRSLGEPLDPGCVYDSNRHVLWGLLTRLGVEPIDLGVVLDDESALRAAFAEAAAIADAVVTTGGVSVGEADHTREAMSAVGEVLFWHVAMRPGRPLAVGRIGVGSALLFGLPGNPVAVVVSFVAFVRDALLRMSGAIEAPSPVMHAIAETPFPKRPGRTEYARGIVESREDGRAGVRLAGAQGSGILSSMSQANALVVLEHERGPVHAGEGVEVLLFEGVI